MGRPGPGHPRARLIDRLHATAADQDRTGSIIELRTLRSLDLAAAGDEAAAVRSLAETLRL